MAREMKDSCIPWIYNIPNDWKIMKMNMICSLVTDFVASGSFADLAKNVEYLDEPDYAMLIRTADVSNKGHISKPVYINKHTYDFLSNSNLFGGELLFPNIGGIGDVYIVPKLYERMSLAPNAIICKTHYYDKYYYYYFNCEAGRRSLIEISQSTAQAKFNKTDFRQIRALVPSIQEQQSIADFLDTQCAHIDSVIEKTRVAIEEYKKLKQAGITQAVTKGIRPNREMKDSGTGYIEQIPVEWEVVKLRYLGICQNGISKGGEYFGSGFPFVSYSDVYKNMELPLQVEKLVESTEEEQDRYSVLEGDIFFTRTSETIEEIGFTSVCKQTIEKATFAGFLIRVRPVTQKLLIGFSKYYFRSEIHRQYFVKEMNLVTRASLGQELLKKLPVLVPSITEQSEIVAYLDEKTAAIDSLIQKKEQLITELEDYKKSLIYEYVTGKKEVI